MSLCLFLEGTPSLSKVDSSARYDKLGVSSTLLLVLGAFVTPGLEQEPEGEDGEEQLEPLLRLEVSTIEKVIGAVGEGRNLLRVLELLLPRVEGANPESEFEESDSDGVERMKVTEEGKVRD